MSTLDTIKERGTHSYTLTGENRDFERFYLVRPDELKGLLAEQAFEMGKAAGEHILALKTDLADRDAKIVLLERLRSVRSD